MKKLISFLMVLSASLMLSAAVYAAEAPVVTFDTVAISDEEIADYGVVEGYDAYLLNVYLSGVDANRTNANTVSGRVMAAFELTFKADDAAIIDWENSYMWESDAGAELVKGTGAFQISSGEPSRNASFPAKNTTIAADETNLFASALIYIPEGKSLDFEVYQLSMVFSTYASGSISDASLTKIYNIANPDSPVTCETKSLKLGESAPSEPEKAPEYFNASFTAGGPKYNGNKGMKFFFNSSKLNKVAEYIFNFDEMFKDPTFEAETEVDVAIKVNDVPEDDTVTLTGYEWSETARVDN